MSKIIKLRSGTYVPGLGLVSIPTHIYRANKSNSWVIDYAAYPDAEYNNFADGTYGSVAKSLVAAIDALKQMEDQLTVGRMFRRFEQEGKNITLGCVGISYHISGPTPKKPYAVHWFVVSDVANKKSIKLYIGNDNTYLRNWDRVLRRAEDIRHQAEREYTIRNYWLSLKRLPPDEPKWRKRYKDTSTSV